MTCKVSRGTVMSQKGDYMRHRFGGNIGGTKENNQKKKLFATTQRQH